MPSFRFPAWVTTIQLLLLPSLFLVPATAAPLQAPATAWRQLNQPELHNATIVGCQASRPCLIPIAVTGAKPISLSIQNLPPGLRLDLSRQMIVGQASSVRTSHVLLTASNAAGTTSEKITLIVERSQGVVALTPPMGWNSYDAFGDSVTQAEMLANARAVARYLKPHGWQYVVVDYCWFDPKAHDNNPNGDAGEKLPIDRYGRLLPAVNRFPSARGNLGFAPLAHAIHAMGLKFGIHIMRGIPRTAVEENTPIAGSPYHARDAADIHDTCGWCPFMYGVRNNAAGQAWYNSIFRQYARWGLDFVKVDDLSNPYHEAEIEEIHKAIALCGRSIVFSTSPGPTPVAKARNIAANANMWRCTGDFWDNWQALYAAFDYQKLWFGHGGPGHWPDLDMLPLGILSVGNRSVGPMRETNFTHAEQRTLLTLWCLAPSPLMLGGDFSHASLWERSLLTNDAVLAIDQDPAGRQAVHALSNPHEKILFKQLSNGSWALGLFNCDPNSAIVTASWKLLGLQGRYTVKNLWSKTSLGTAVGAVSRRVAAHGAALLLLTKLP